MSENIRALFVLLLIGLVVQALDRPLRSEALPGAHVLRRNLWFAMTVAAFALGSFWSFALVAGGLLLWAGRRERNLPALFLALLFVVPPVETEIPGMGLVNFLFGLNLPRLMVLVLLLPVFVRLIRERTLSQGGWTRAADLLFGAYVFVQILLLGREPSVTSALRGAFYVLVDTVLPFYVFSRSLDNLEKLRDAAAAMVWAGLLLAAIGSFEATRHWLLYSALAQGWGSTDTLQYLGRGGLLRAMASTGHAIALGYVLAICLLLYLPMRGRLSPGWRPTALLMLLGAGLLSALSRGPWMGAAAGLVLYLALGPRALKNVLLLMLCGVLALAVLPFLPNGNLLLGLIPFLGHVEVANIEYRQRLFENASQLIWAHPLLGSGNYTERLAAMGMVQGQGIVDVVNTYVQIALRSGFVGLACFGGFMLFAWLSALHGRKLSLVAQRRNEADFGRSLAAAQLAVLVTIGTASSILVIPWVYWCLAGMLVAYARVVKSSVEQVDSPVASSRISVSA
jgi:O-antigen ligase